MSRPALDVLADLQDVRSSLVADRVLVHADDRLLAAIDLALIVVRRVGDLLRRKTARDRLDHAAHLVDALDVSESVALDPINQRLHSVTVWDDDDYRAESERVGADAYVVKSRLASDLVAAVRTALAHQGVQSP